MDSSRKPAGHAVTQFTLRSFNQKAAQTSVLFPQASYLNEGCLKIRKFTISFVQVGSPSACHPVFKSFSLFKLPVASGCRVWRITGALAAASTSHEHRVVIDLTIQEAGQKARLNFQQPAITETIVEHRMCHECVHA